MRVVLYGGPFNGATPELRTEPERIEVQGIFYSRINDPDTGESLGAYIVEKTKGTGK